MKLKIKYKDKELLIDNIKICSSFEMFKGLMFSHKKTAKPLLFDFGKLTRMRIHSLFVFFPFLAIWLDEKNSIIDTKIVKPFTLSIKPKKHFSKLIEIPLNLVDKGKI